ncbi:hypothetical protein Salat_2913800 [Sesamum alatum]|uniref:RWP-RK domain-containing protein n=1 Tax=Sesamum alatum TaxID=300844 RepID=A0AAE2C888_9LAMI|nr:hypothetical protein Salat_2913800 [Sesamum alatum]
MPCIVHGNLKRSHRDEAAGRYAVGDRNVKKGEVWRRKGSHTGGSHGHGDHGLEGGPESLDPDACGTIPSEFNFPEFMQLVGRVLYTGDRDSLQAIQLLKERWEAKYGLGNEAAGWGPEPDEGSAAKQIVLAPAPAPRGFASFLDPGKFRNKDEMETKVTTAALGPDQASPPPPAAETAPEKLLIYRLMADQNANVPHIMDAISSAEQLLMFGDENQDDDPLLHSFVNEMAQGQGLADNVLGHYGTSHDLTGIPLQENTYSNDFPQNSAFGNPIRIPIWPVPPSPHTCTCCQSLRQFFHLNGNHVLKLDVHGRLGLISHAVLERYNTDISSQTDHEYHMFDFCKESISSVKQFLVQYCDERKREGYVMLQDPLSHFYNALCIGLDSDGSADADIFLPQTSRGKGKMNQPEEEGNEVRLSKSYISSQRERTGKMKLRDLVGYFHLPLSKASKKMNICPSAIKGICRKEGLLRWPYRKIKCIEGKIAKKKQSLNSNDAGDRARALAEIQELQRKLANIYDALIYLNLGLKLLFMSPKGRRETQQKNGMIVWRLPRDIIEGIAEDSADDVFISAKTRSELSAQLGKINQADECVGLKKGFTLRAVSDERHVAVVADMTFEECLNSKAIRLRCIQEVSLKLFPEPGEEQQLSVLASGIYLSKQTETDTCLWSRGYKGSSCLLPSIVDSEGLIHCCDDADTKQALFAETETTDSIQLHIMSWPNLKVAASPLSGAAARRPPNCC